MFKLTVAVLVLAVVGIQGRPYSDDVEYDCTDREDGIYGVESDPKAFYICKNGTVDMKAVCVDGYKFNGVDICVPDEKEEEEEVKTDILETGEEEEEKRTIPQVFTDNNEDGIFDDDFEGFNRGKKKIFNIEFTKNVFPKSVVIIGKMNREQKNK